MPNLTIEYITDEYPKTAIRYIAGPLTQSDIDLIALLIERLVWGAKSQNDNS